MRKKNNLLVNSISNMSTTYKTVIERSRALKEEKGKEAHKSQTNKLIAEVKRARKKEHKVKNIKFLGEKPRRKAPEKPRRKVPILSKKTIQAKKAKENKKQAAIIKKQKVVQNKILKLEKMIDNHQRMILKNEQKNEAYGMKADKIRIRLNNLCHGKIHDKLEKTQENHLIKVIKNTDKNKVLTDKVEKLLEKIKELRK
jgi:hypothetical protein